MMNFWLFFALFVAQLACPTCLTEPAWTLHKVSANTNYHHWCRQYWIIDVGNAGRGDGGVVLR